MAGERSGSILAADFGNVTTRVVLIDLVDGVYRLVARGEGRTTGGFPVNNVSAGLARVVQQISQVTGRRLLEKDGRVITPEKQDRSGVDVFGATTSTGRPLRTALVGLVPDVSIASGQRAAAGTYVQIVETLSLDDHRGEEEQLNALIASRPDLIFITGGMEGGAQEPVLQLARIVRLALLLLGGGRKPTVLYAGNNVLVPQIQGMFAGLTRLFVASNIRPSLEAEALGAAQAQLAVAFDAHSANRGGGFEVIGEMSGVGVRPTGQSYALIIEYLGRALENGGGVLAVDVGSATSTLAASLNGRVATSIRTDLGLGHSAKQLLDTVGVEAVRRWLPYDATDGEIVAYALNKTLRPATIPETVRDLYLEHALLRAGVQALVQASRPGWHENLRELGEMTLPRFGLLIGAGSGLTKTGHPGFNALLMLDALQPTGVTSLRADPFGLVAVMGALAHANPQAAVQTLDSHSLEPLGTSISLSGSPRVGRTALKIKITLPNGERLKQEVQGGHLWVYPLGVGQTAKVEVRAAGRGVKIGSKGSFKGMLEGGTAGLIFDARGRPLPLAMDAAGRAGQLPVWLSEVTGMAVKTAEERRVEAPEEAPGAPRKRARLKTAPPPSGAGLRRGRGKPPQREAKQPRKQPEEEPTSDLDDLRNVLS